MPGPLGGSELIIARAYDKLTNSLLRLMHPSKYLHYINQMPCKILQPNLLSTSEASCWPAACIVRLQRHISQWLGQLRASSVSSPLLSGTIARVRGSVVNMAHGGGDS